MSRASTSSDHSRPPSTSSRSSRAPWARARIGPTPRARSSRSCLRLPQRRPSGDMEWIPPERPDPWRRGDRRPAAGLSPAYEAEEVAVHGSDGDRPRVTYQVHGEAFEIACDFIAGCDGFHGVCRATVPPDALTTYEKVYPAGWLGLLSDTP